MKHVINYCTACGWRSTDTFGFGSHCPDCGDRVFFVAYEPHEESEAEEVIRTNMSRSAKVNPPRENEIARNE